MTINNLKIVLAFIMTTVIMCAINFIAQIVLIFTDIVSRMETSSALAIVLWMVTGVFAAIFTEAAAELFIDKKDITYRLIHTPVLVVYIIAIVLAVILMLQGEFMSDPSDFTLLLSNGFVFISYFFGTAGMAFIGRKL